MGYACPVCEDPQADGEHLANHLAFTAMLGDEAHEAWLDDHAPDWAADDPADLAPRVVDHADETEFPQVFEDTTGEREHDHDHGSRLSGRDHDPSEVLDAVGSGGVADSSDLFDDSADRDPDEVLAEARELTRRRRANADRDDSGETRAQSRSESANGNGDEEDGDGDSDASESGTGG